jgi:hypothetical protein
MKSVVTLLTHTFKGGEFTSINAAFGILIQLLALEIEAYAICTT